MTVMGGCVSLHVGSVKLLVVLPPVKTAVKVNWIGVPQTKPGAVLTE